MIDSSVNKFYFLSGSTSSGTYVELDGINNLSLSVSSSFDKNFTLGGQESASQVNAPTQIELSFDRSFIQRDPLIAYTGSSPIVAASIYNGKYYHETTNLYLTAYTAGFAVGDLPRINTRFTSYDGEVKQSNSLRGNIVSGQFSELQRVQIPLDIPKLGSIFITGSNVATLNLIRNNAQLFGFEYNLSISRTPYYSVGQKLPTEVCPILPIEISLSISSKLLTSSINDILQPSFFQADNFEFDIAVSGTGGLAYFPIRKGKYISNEIQVQSKNTMELKRNFIGYYGL